MANYKLITQTATGTTSQLLFTASATNTVVSSITAKDGNLQVAEVLIQKSGGSVIELAEVELTTNGGTQIIDVAFALEAGDKVFTRASRSGMKFIMSYVEETDVPGTTALGGLADVDTTGAGDGQSLVYNGSTQGWEPVTITGGTGGGAGELDDLNDVAITSASSGNILRHNGSSFVNVTPTTAMIQETTGSRYLDITNEQKLDNITVTGAADLDDIATNSAKVSFPGFGTTAGTALEGNTALFSGAYADLTGKPSLFDGDYNSLSNQPALFSGAYADLTGQPSIPADLDDLSNVSSTAPSTGEVLKWNGSAWAPATDISGSGSGAVSSVNTQTGAVVLDADDIDDSSTTHKFVSQTEMDKLNHITITTDVNITTLKNLADTNNAGVLLAVSAANTASADLNTHQNSLENHDDITFDYTSTSGQASSRPDGAFIVWDETRAQWCDIPVSIFSGAYADLTGAPSIPSSLDGLNDVAISGIQNGQILVYDDDDGEFRNQAFTLGWNDISGKPSTFTPASHTHVAADISDFNTKVDQRIAAAGSTQHHETTAVSTLGDTNNGAETMELTTTSLTLVVGDIYSLGSTGWEAATNTTDSADKMLAIPVNGNDDGSEMLIKGVVKIDLNTSGASIGDTVYLGTGNKATLAAPTSAAYVIKLGRVIDPANNTIFFNPDSTSIKVQ